jgi:hypothetical protein
MLPMIDDQTRFIKLVEQVSAEVKSLQDSATKLAQLVGVFKLIEIQAAHVPMPVPTARAVRVSPSDNASVIHLPLKGISYKPDVANSGQVKKIVNVALSSAADREEFWPGTNRAAPESCHRAIRCRLFPELVIAQIYQLFRLYSWNVTNLQSR